MKQLCIVLLLISSTIFPASTGRTHEMRVQFPDSNIILHTLESSWINYQREEKRDNWDRITTLDFPAIAEQLANKTLATHEAKKLIIGANVYVSPPYLNQQRVSQNIRYALTVLTKCCIITYTN